MAKAFDAKTRNGSRDTARMAGIESTAKTTSVVSTRIRTAKSGVASRAPVRRVNIFCPSYSVVEGTTRRTSFEDGIVLGMDLGARVAGDLDRRVQQEGAEDVEHPVEGLDQGHTGEDEDGAQDEGAEDAPEQHPELVLGRYGEVREDHRPHEDVVDGEALLDQVAGQVLTGGRPSERPGDDPAEGEADGDPHRALDPGLPQADRVRAPVDDEQVAQEEDGDAGHQRHPRPRRHLEGDEVAGALPLLRRSPSCPMTREPRCLRRVPEVLPTRKTGPSYRVETSTVMTAGSRGLLPSEAVTIPRP